MARLECYSLLLLPRHSRRIGVVTAIAPRNVPMWIATWCKFRAVWHSTISSISGSSHLLSNRAVQGLRSMPERRRRVSGRTMELPTEAVGARGSKSPIAIGLARARSGSSAMPGRTVTGRRRGSCPSKLYTKLRASCELVSKRQ